MKKTQLTHAEYCHNRMARLNGSSFLFPDGVSVHLIDGEYLTEAEREEKYPINLPLISWHTKKHNKGENPNKKNNFKTL
jgi:hypothetical protein